MKNFYYSIWVDTIINIKKNPKHKKDWKLLSMVYMTLLNSLNFGVVLMCLSYVFNFKVIWVRITIFPGSMLNSFASFIIQFAIPFIILNYVLIFYKNRYTGLIQNYSDKKGKLFAAYLLSSIGLFVACIITYMWLS
jgi:vacuolar-type H+-ATPase subunit I/STV1